MPAKRVLPIAGEEDRNFKYWITWINELDNKGPPAEIHFSEPPVVPSFGAVLIINLVPGAHGICVHSSCELSAARNKLLLLPGYISKTARISK